MIKSECQIAAITRSEKGSVILEGETIIEVPAEPIEKLVDATGAGDLYAAGFLTGSCDGTQPQDLRTIGQPCRFRSDHACGAASA